MIYFVQNETTGAVKIGYTGNEPEERVRQMRSSNDGELRILAAREGDRELEKALHKAFQFAQIRGEWFKPVPSLVQHVQRFADGDPELDVVGETDAVGRGGSLVGRFLLTLTEDGELAWKGRVDDADSGGLVLELYDWASSRSSYRYVPWDEIDLDRFRFYSDLENLRSDECRFRDNCECPLCRPAYWGRDSYRQLLSDYHT